MTFTELHEAATHQNHQLIIDLSRKHPSYARETDANGETPLHIYSFGNPDLSAFKTLLAAYPEANHMRNIHGDTPLHNACHCFETEKHLVQMMLDVDPSIASIVNKEGLMPLHVACRHISDNEGVIGLLLDYNPGAAKAAIKIGNPPEKRSLALSKENNHAIIDPSQGMAHRDAEDMRFHDTLWRQIRDGSYPLHMALENVNTPIPVIEMLIKVAPEILHKTNKFGETPLHVALKKDAHLDVIEALVMYGKEAVKMQERRHRNLPLHVAAMNGCSLQVMKTLLEVWPAAALVRNNDKFTPLMLAESCHKSSMDVVRMIRNAEVAANVIHV